MKTSKVINNSIINLTTQVIPIFIALIFIPISIKALGNEQFGIYSLVVTFIVLFNYINFGIAPATTKELAKYLAKGNQEKVVSLLINSFFMMLVIGIVMAAILILFHDKLAGYMIHDISLQKTLSSLLNLLGFLSPFLMLVIFLRSVLEAKQLFLVTSLNRAFLNSMILVLPSIVFIPGFTILSVFYFLIYIYILSAAILAFFMFKEYFKNQTIIFHIRDSKHLLGIGFWMMLSSLAGIGLYYSDRFIIGATISAIAVAYYVAAYDLVTRLNIISGSLTSALFPAFAHWYEVEEKEKIRNAVVFVSKVILFFVVMISFIIIVYSKELLSWWISEEYSLHSSFVLQLLTIGVLFNTLSVVPFRTISAIGFPKIVAIVYIIETPLVVSLTYYSIQEYGLVGAVIGYSIRALIEMAVLYYIMVHEKIGLNFQIYIFSIARIVFVVFCIYISAFAIASMDNLSMKGICSFVILIAFTIIYKWILNEKEKNKLLEYKAKLKAKF